MRGSYSVNGVGAGVTLIPPDAPTVSHGDEITLTEWVRVPVDLTSSGFEEGENIGHRDQQVVVTYTVRARPGEPPYLLQTYATPGPGAIELKHPFILWIGEGAYRITKDPDVAKHRLSPVMPRPIRIDPDARYRVRTIILDPPSDQEQVVDIEPISGSHWFATRGTPLSAEDTGSAAGTWYRVELLPAANDDDTVIEAYEVTAQ